MFSGLTKFDALTTSQKPEEADFYPLLANMLLDMPEEDLTALCAELLKLSFQKQTNFRDAFYKENPFCVTLMIALLQSDYGPFNGEMREALLENKSALNAHQRIKLLTSAFNEKRAFLSRLLAPLYFEVLRTPESDKVAKPPKDSAAQAFVTQIIKLIQFRLNQILPDEEGFEKTLINYLKAEISSLNAERKFKPLELDIQLAIQDPLHQISDDSIEQLKEIWEQWSLLLKKDLQPLYKRVEELSSLWAYMGQSFPPKSPRAGQFIQLNVQIREQYNKLLDLLANEDLEEEFRSQAIETTNQVITELIAPEINKYVAGLTPLHRLAKEKPVKEEEKDKIAIMMNRLLKEGAKLEEKTTFYHRRIPTAIIDSISQFPWIGEMIRALFTNPKRDVFGISESTDVLNQALKQKGSSANKKEDEGLLSHLKKSVLLRFSSSKPKSTKAATPAEPLSKERKETLRAS